MKPFSVFFVALIAVTTVVVSEAQSQQPQHDLVPQGIEMLRQSATSKTEFTLDHSMLVFASKLDPDNDDLRRVIAGVSGVSVRSYRFRGFRMYDPAALSSVKQEYRT